MDDGVQFDTIRPSEIPRIRQRTGAWRYPELYYSLLQGVPCKAVTRSAKTSRRIREAVRCFAKKRGLEVESHHWTEDRQPDRLSPAYTVHVLAFIPRSLVEASERNPTLAVPRGEEATMGPLDPSELPPIPEPEGDHVVERPTTPARGPAPGEPPIKEGNIPVEEWARQRRLRDPLDAVQVQQALLALQVKRGGLPAKGRTPLE